MVWSASAIESIRGHRRLTDLVAKQALFAINGLAALVFRLLAAHADRPRPGLAGHRGRGPPALLVLVPGIGVAVHGQQNWIDLGGRSDFSPPRSLLAPRRGGADVPTRKYRAGHRLATLVPWSRGWRIMFLVTLEGDFGNATIIAFILMGLFFRGGAPRAVVRGLRDPGNQRASQPCRSGRSTGSVGGLRS